MKKAILILISFLLLVNYSCKKKIDFEKEKEAILAVSEEEAAGLMVVILNDGAQPMFRIQPK